VFSIRVWRQEKAPNQIGSDQDIIDRLYRIPEDWPDKAGIAMALLELERVNAVEVIDLRDQEGIVLYKDWP